MTEQNTGAETVIETDDVVVVENDAATAVSEFDEGELAADYLEGLLDIVDIDGDLEISEHAGRVHLTVAAPEDGDAAGLRRLARGETVGALQELTRLAVQARTGGFARLILDVGGSRDARSDELRAMVDAAVAKLTEGATSAALPPMSSYERKLVHDLVAERGYHSESHGEGRDRHTVIVPA